MLLNPDMILLQREKQQRKRQGELLTLAAAITLEIIDPFLQFVTSSVLGGPDSYSIP